MPQPRKKWPRGMFILRDRIPGLGRPGDSETIHGVGVGRVQAEKARARRRLGARTRGQLAEDADMRALGVDVFDRNAGQSELDSYRGR